MNELSIFENQEFGQVRVVEVGNEPWFVGKDIAEALGYSNTRDALATHVDNEDKADVVIHDGRQKRTMNGINESGMYSLILSSKLPTAKKFKHWVTSEILPSIRKNGHYITSKENLEEFKLKAQQDRAKAILLNAQSRALKTLMATIDDKKLSPIAVQVFGLKAIEQVTGEDMGQYLPQCEKTYSATEIGKKLGISANKVGSIANKHHLKTDEYGLTVMDKSRYSDKKVSSFRYYERVIPVIGKFI